MPISFLKSPMFLASSFLLLFGHSLLYWHPIITFYGHTLLTILCKCWYNISLSYPVVSTGNPSISTVLITSFLTLLSTRHPTSSSPMVQFNLVWPCFFLLIYHVFDPHVQILPLMVLQILVFIILVILSHHNKKLIPLIALIPR
jgi:hypothetical protein